MVDVTDPEEQVQILQDIKEFETAVKTLVKNESIPSKMIVKQIRIEAETLDGEKYVAVLHVMNPIMIG